MNTTGSITQGIPSTNLQLDLRQSQQDDPSKVDAIQYTAGGYQPTTANYSYQPHHVHHILNIHNHRSLTNSPISNPGSPGLDMIQEEMTQHGCISSICNKQDIAQGSVVCHPQISVTDVLGMYKK